MPTYPYPNLFHHGVSIAIWNGKVVQKRVPMIFELVYPKFEPWSTICSFNVNFYTVLIMVVYSPTVHSLQVGITTQTRSHRHTTCWWREHMSPPTSIGVYIPPILVIDCCFKSYRSLLSWFFHISVCPCGFFKTRNTTVSPAGSISPWPRLLRRSIWLRPRPELIPASKTPRRGQCLRPQLETDWCFETIRKSDFVKCLVILRNEMRCGSCCWQDLGVDFQLIGSPSWSSGEIMKNLHWT